jgi:hypothetical protein
MAAVTRRLRSLAVLELVNVPLWAVAFFSVLGFPLTPANLAGFAVFALLLVEGAVYWTLKLRQLKSRAQRLPGVAVYRVLRVVNVGLIVAALAVTVAAAVTSPGKGSFPGLFLALFGAAEHVNYFHVQLMHDTRADLRRLFSTGFRRSSLSRDLARTSSQPGTGCP